jgi:alpha-L-fucosidase
MEGPASAQQDQQRLGWYQEAKFGLFIHWGAYSVAGVEASWPIMAPELSAAMFGTQISIDEKEYVKLPSRFNPVDFDPDEWVGLALEAGMRYIVLTSKHHDGFCMFDAPGTDYKITNTPYGKDICLELAQACHRAGMPLGFYYSPPDMHHPGYRDTRKPATRNWTGEPQRKGWAEYLDYMESHIRKLLTDYGEVAVMWFDGLTNHGKYDPQRFHKLVHELSPNTLINDRLGDDYDFITPEQFIPHKGIPARTFKPPSGIDPGGDGFFKTVSFLSKVPVVGGWLRKQMRKYSDGTLELTPVHQEPYPSPEYFQPWETCMTMGQTWAYNPKEITWKEPGALVRNLVNVVSRGGNYLLNVGPTAQGAFPPEAVERLRYIGRWMNAYHQAIYGATYTPLQDQPWGQVTRKADKLYLHVFDWLVDGKLIIDPFPGGAKAVSLFSGEALAFRQDGMRLAIGLPAQSLDPEVSVLTVDIDPKEEGWKQYSTPVPTRITPQKHIQKQAIASALINSILNGLIAFFSFRTRGDIPYGEAAVDILITVFIITFLTAWITVGLARGEVIKGNLIRLATAQCWLILPKSPALRGLLIALACTILFGGLFLDGLLYLVSPVELSNWAYFVLKTVYTGASGALASALTIWSVVNDANRS